MPNADTPLVLDSAELQIKPDLGKDSNILEKLFDGLLAVIFVSVTGFWAALLIWAMTRVIG